jgi:hypothetical protein
MSSRKRTPDKESTETPTATAAETDKPGTMVEEPQGRTGFAERVGQKKWPTAPDPFGIAGDYAAGVRLFDSKQDRQVALKFAEKPPQPVIDKVKEAGFHWQPADQIWARPYGDSPMTARIEGERLYQEVRQMVRQAKGIEAGPEIPF